MRALYFDCTSGAAGDMLLGALLDAGASLETVQEHLQSLDVGGWELRSSRVTSGGLAATKIDVRVAPGPRRSYRDLVEIISRAALPEGVQRRALATFEVLARAEAAVHGADLDGVHLHETGGLDALVDIVGCASALDQLAPGRVVTSPIATGWGTMSSDHGELPLPAPAVAEILKGAVLFGRGTEELVTPTGAAILACATDEFGEMPALRLESVGYGAGSKELEWPNVVRVLIGEMENDDRASGAVLVEANLDDMSPELLPHAIDMLMAAGAQDAWLTPIVMKKGRPAYTLSVLVGEGELDRALDVVYRETTTLGVRIANVAKDILDREWVEVDVGGHSMRVKIGRRSGQQMTVSPEFDDAVRVARSTGMALKDVYAEALRAAHERDRG